MKHIAVIPARKGSVGFKFKNRKFFNMTADFLDQSNLFSDVIVSTNDEVVKEYSLKRNYKVHDRSEELSAGDVSIKAVFENLINENQFSEDTVLWLFYLPVLYKNREDFEKAISLYNEKKMKSLMSFVPVEVHPYTCWRLDNNTPKQFIENNAFRRQDMPDAWSHYHYLCALSVSEISNLNDELIGKNTFPIKLDQNTKNNLVEIDTPEDLEKWEKINS